MSGETASGEIGHGVRVQVADDYPHLCRGRAVDGRRLPDPRRITDWAEVRARHVNEWTTWLLGQYSDFYANNQFRGLQQFFKWCATEPRPNPVAHLKPPKVGDKLVPVFTEAELAIFAALTVTHLDKVLAPYVNRATSSMVIRAITGGKSCRSPSRRS
jgi:hypothetical protein